MLDDDSNTICDTKRVSVRQLIKMVHERRCLWDRIDASYNHREAKEEAWREICTALRPEYKDMNEVHKIKFGYNITRKWYNLRDAYVKSRRTENRNRPYLYSDLLSFVDDIYFGQNPIAKRHYRNTGDSYSADKMTEKSDDDDEERNDEEEIDTQSSFINEVLIDSEEPLSKKLKTEEGNKLVNNTDYNSIVGVLDKLIEKEDDEDRAFFKSITPTVKKLSESKKFEFRIQVMKLLDKFRKDDNNLRMKIERLSDEESDI